MKIMKRATSSIAILFLLAGPVAVLAETPAAPASPLDTSAARAAVVESAEPVLDALPTAATAAGTAAVEAQSQPVDTAPAAATASAAKTTTSAVSETPAAPAAGTASAADSGDPCPMHRMGKKRMGGDGCGMRGMQQGAGCKCKGKGKQKGKRHAEVVQRLDMIEARMAKIEAMLESLMKRPSD
jgi:hypothetical protein